MLKIMMDVTIIFYLSIKILFNKIRLDPHWEDIETLNLLVRQTDVRTSCQRDSSAWMAETNVWMGLVVDRETKGYDC